MKTTTYAMPAIPMDNLEGEAREYALAITVPAQQSRVLRSSKPTGKGKGRLAYVWRMVAFTISPNPRHQCMPVTADFDLSAEAEFRTSKSEYSRDGLAPDHDAIRAECARLDKVVDEIIAAVPKESWAGVLRWGRALGLVGRPEVNTEGAVVYR